MRETFLGIAGHSFPQSDFYILCHLRILGLTKTAILIVKLSGCRYTLGHKSLVKSVAWEDSQASQSNNLSDAFFLMFLPVVAYYATTTIQIMLFFFFFFSYVFLKCASIQYSISTKKKTFFTSSSPRCLVCAFDWLLTYQVAVFPLAYASSIVLGNSFRKHSAMTFQSIFFF